MSYAQWVFEATALHKRDERENERLRSVVTEVYKAATTAFRETLISLLGLNIGAGKPVVDEKGEEGPTPFFGLTTFVGRPEVMEELYERESDEKQVKNALTDPGLDTINEDLMQLDAGDLEPLWSGAHSEDPFERWQSKEVQEMLESLGIEKAPPSEDGEEPDEASKLNLPSGLGIGRPRVFVPPTLSKSMLLDPTESTKTLKEDLKDEDDPFNMEGGPTWSPED